MAKITFAELETSTSKAGQKTAKRTPESKAAKAVEVITNGVRFLGDASHFASQVVSGESVEFEGGHVVSADSPSSAACVLCGQTHGVKGGNGRIVDADNFARTLVFVGKDGNPIFVGNSGVEGCYAKYLTPAIKASVSSVDGLARLNSVTGSSFKSADAPKGTGGDKGDKRNGGNQPKAK